MPTANPSLFREEDRMRFARLMLRWRSRAGWSHQTLHDWGDAAGFKSPRNSTFSRLERGLIQEPGLVTFLQLGECNRRLAEQDYGPVTNRRLMDLLKAQVPITTADGELWSCAEFFGYFIGKGTVCSQLADHQPIEKPRGKKAGDDRLADLERQLDELKKQLAALSSAH